MYIQYIQGLCQSRLSFLSNSLYGYLYRLDTDHPQKTHQLLSNGYPVMLSGVSTHVLPANGHLIVAYSLLRGVFTGLLPISGCPVVGCALVGTCLPIRFLETVQSITI
jgi:hypothetical protein